jgi:predicted secreted protein
MNRPTLSLLLLLAASSLVLVGIAGMSLLGPQTFTASDNGKNVTVNAGETFWISLPENPTAGYAWDLKLSDGLAKLSDKYEPADRSGMKVGVGGTHSYEIKATKTGLQMVVGNYTQPQNASSGSLANYSLIVNVVQGGPLSGIFRLPAMIADSGGVTRGACLDLNNALSVSELTIPSVAFPAFPVIWAGASAPPLSGDSNGKVSRDIQLSYVDVPPDDTVSASFGDLITLTLPENPSTGYSWQISASDGLEQVSDHYIQGNTGTAARPIVGAGGTHEWVFKVIKPGNQQVTGVYKRPWEATSEGEKRYTLNVNAV